MPFNAPSEAAGPAFLSILLAIAFLLAWRAPPKADRWARLIAPASLTLALQSLHVAEEFSTGFHRQAPAMLGLEPWSPSFFVSFNLAAIASWALALAAFASGRANAFWSGLLWFLAISSMGNALWHPAISLIIGGYFPGTVTAPFLGIAGYLLARALIGQSSL
jgi:hypothetical protein